MHERREQVRDDTEEGVHVERLIRPVILRAERQPERIFARAEHALDHGLAAVRANDLSGRPVVLIGHEHESAEPLPLEAIERGEVHGVGECPRAPTPVEAHVEELAQVLAPEPLGDLRLDRGAGAPRRAAGEGGLELVEPAHGPGEVLLDAAALALLQPRRHEHDERALRALHESARAAAELYTAVGLQKQGKTLFYRDVQEHLAHATDRFVEAPGARGLVMVVFTLPSFPCVFKLMRDTFGAPKRSTHDDVRRQYQLVKHHDRVGRMADTLEFSDVAFPLARFDAALLAELETACASMVERDGERLIVKHLYIEARVTPLDLYLRGADDARARHGILEYGRAIRELAAAGIFPGDLFCKNFGVTSTGRVVFYDYDEVALLTELTFRDLVAPRDDLDELSAEPWYSVGPNDVFPEEWPSFLFAPGRDRTFFLEMHAELVTARWWAARQDDIRRGVVPDVLPYPEELRLGSRSSAAAH